MRESTIENLVCTYARNHSWLSYKFVSPNLRGVPDRMFMKDGKMFFIEFKAPGGKLTKLQRKRIVDIQFSGFDVHVVDDVKNGEALFK